METYCNAFYMENGLVPDAIATQACRFRAMVNRMRKRRAREAAAKDLAALTPWLRKDLGVGEDGRPLDRKNDGTP